MAEYEALWAHQKATFKSIADFFRNCSLSLGGRTQVASITEKSSEGTRQSCLVCIEPLNEKNRQARACRFSVFFRTARHYMQRKSSNLLIYMVGGAGFEPATLAV